MFTSPGEIAFKIGYIPVHYYGLCLAIAMVTGIFVAYYVCKHYYKDINPDIIFDISIPVIIFGILGARIYYCLCASNYYILNPIEILQIYKGGLSVHGGILGGLCGGIAYTKYKKLPTLKLCDIFSFALVCGQIIGRWGNFFNSEAFGTPCNNFLKLYIAPEHRPAKFMNYDFFHPTFLYESLLNVIVLILLLILLKKRHKEGIIFFTYILSYSIIRLFTESLRIDSVLNIHGVPVATIVSFALILISLGAIIYLNLRQV